MFAMKRITAKAGKLFERATALVLIKYGRNAKSSVVGHVLNSKHSVKTS